MWRTLLWYKLGIWKNSINFVKLLKNKLGALQHPICRLCDQSAVPHSQCYPSLKKFSQHIWKTSCLSYMIICCVTISKEITQCIFLILFYAGYQCQPHSLGLEHFKFSMELIMTPKLIHQYLF